jgi:hypothetical protein
MRGLIVVRTIGVAARVGAEAVDAITAARRLDRRWFVRPHPLRWLRSASLDERMAPYSAIGNYLPLDARRR